MYINEIIGVLVVVLSILFAILGFYWNIEILQSLSTFLAGAFTTYLVQHRLQIKSEKRKTYAHMRDTIYGPIFEETSKILEKITKVQSYGWSMPEPLKGIMSHYLFFTIKDDLRSKLSEILHRVEKYLSVRRATEVMLRNIIRTNIEKTYHIDIGTNENEPHLHLRVGEVHVAFINLIRTLLLGIEPRDFVRTETEKWGENAILEVSIGTEKGDLSDFESIYKAVLNEAAKESLYRDEKEQKARLVGELEAFLDEIKVFVKLV